MSELSDSRETGEFELIRWIRERSRTDHPATVLGIGDDCAILQFRSERQLVVTTDMLMDGRHFRLDRDGAVAAGFKAMAVNISDIAAMAANPVAAVVAVALPKHDGRAAEIARGLHTGLTEAAGKYNVALVGGDTNAWDGPLVVSVTVIGETTGRGAVRRSGAKPGDLVFVTGPLGGSLLGRHLRPTPRVAEAIALNAEVPLHAMIDVSDGLLSDLNHILEESGDLGAVIDASKVPIHPDATEMSRGDGRSRLDHALRDGEDFELCVVMSCEDYFDLYSKRRSLAKLLTNVGEIVETPGLRLRTGDGEPRAIEPTGFDHFKN